MLRIINLILIFFYFQHASTYERSFVILIPSYKNALYYKKNLDSVFEQTYQNYRVIYIDDCSPDGTCGLVENYVKEKKQDHRFLLIKNRKRELALANIYKSILRCKDDEIIVLLDGDDYLSNNNVLSYLNNIYQNSDIWITHGSYKYLSNNLDCQYDPRIPEHIIKENQFREHPHGLIHIRTFYSWLFKQIKIEDLFFEEEFFKMTYDAAIFLPMIEMASQRHCYIKEILYIYNDNNPINDHTVSKSYQHYLNKIIRQKKKYNRLENSKINFLNQFDTAKTDIIIFLNDLNNFQNLYHFLKNKIFSFSKIYIINTSNATLNSDVTSNFFIINKSSLNKNLISKIFNNIFDNDSQYIMFLDEKIYTKNIINLNQEIKNLELTKAFCQYMGLYDDYFMQNIQIMDNLYSFNYCMAKYYHLVSGALYRKKDITQTYNSFEKLEIEWKTIGWNKICIFKCIEPKHD